MLVRVSTLQEGRRVGWQGIDRPSPTVTASGASKGSGRGATEIQVLVEPWEDEDDVKLRAQRGGAMREYDDVTNGESHTVVAAAPTNVQIEPHAFGPRRRASIEKPLYRVPSMDEIRAIPWNGCDVVSTFSGGGGSCLGYRMAGYRVRLAVEISPKPIETYRANFDSTVFDRSIREVTGREILKAIGRKKGDLELFDGSPPCTSFSTAGLRSKTWGQEREHAGAVQRIDDLFFDYARLLEELQPKTFIAENVKGLVTGAAIGYFKAILRTLRECGYVVACQLLDADRLGVPQNRERTFFVGVRADVAKKLGIDVDALHEDVFPKALPYSYTVRDALPWLDPSAQAFSIQGTPFGSPERIAAGKATPPERVKDAAGSPAATVTASGAAGKQGVQVIHDTQGSFGQGPHDVLDEPSPAITVGRGSQNASHFKIEAGAEIASPDGAKWKAVETDDGTIVWRRKFTILEVKRLCSFPDDFEMRGSFAQQWAVCGNSVPPLMTRAVAERLHDRVLSQLSATAPRRRRAA